MKYKNLFKFLYAQTLIKILSLLIILKTSLIKNKNRQKMIFKMLNKN